jgi:hypothetical protein
MLFSAQEMFSNKQAVTATAVSTNVVDLGATGTTPGGSAPLKWDAGKGTVIPLWVGANVAFVGLTSMAISVEVDDNEAFTSAKTVFTSPVYTLAQLVPATGNLLPNTIPIGTNERYVRLRYTVVGAATAGQMTAGVSAGNQTN